MGGIASVPGRGRKAKPTEIKRADGNPGKRPLNKNAPDFTEVVDIAPPLYFEGLEYAPMIWQSIVPELLENKVLRITDMHNVEAFCIAYDNYRRAQQQVNEEGVTVQGAMGGPIKNPALTALNEAVRQMVTLGSVLGLDPSSRQRLTGNPDKKKTNSFASVLDM